MKERISLSIFANNTNNCDGVKVVNDTVIADLVYHFGEKDVNEYVLSADFRAKDVDYITFEGTAYIPPDLPDKLLQTITDKKHWSHDERVQFFHDRKFVVFVNDISPWYNPKPNKWVKAREKIVEIKTGSDKEIYNVLKDVLNIYSPHELLLPFDKFERYTPSWYEYPPWKTPEQYEIDNLSAKSRE